MGPNLVFWDRCPLHGPLKYQILVSDTKIYFQTKKAPKFGFRQKRLETGQTDRQTDRQTDGISKYVLGLPYLKKLSSEEGTAVSIKFNRDYVFFLVNFFFNVVFGKLLMVTIF